jgi:aminoglycoside phosphotransferase
VVDVYDVGHHEGCVYLVMERLYGQPLSAMLTNGPLEPEAVVRLLMPALRA